MKKLFALLLVVIMTVGLFSGCNNAAVLKPLELTEEVPYEMDETGKVLDNYFEGVEVEWWFSSSYGLNSDMYLFKKLEEVIGCKIKVVRYDSEVYRVKVNTALQTNSLPDMCAMIIEHPVYNVYGDQGAFVNLLDENVMKRMPNLAEKILNNPECAELLEFYKSEAGGLYGMPRWDTEREVNFGWMYREDIFEKHGIEMWTDTESFVAVLRQLKQLYPESYPMGGASMESVFDRVCTNYGFNAVAKAYNWETKQWYLGATDEGYFEMMTMFHMLWDEGLMDPDVFTNQTNHLDEGVFNNVNFVYNSWIGRMSVENTYAKTSPDQVDAGFHMAFAPEIGNGVSKQLAKMAMTGTVINAQSKGGQIVTEACMAIYNYLYSDEGIEVMTMGEEGVTFDTVDGVRVYKDRNGNTMLNPTIQNLEENFGLWNGSTYVLASRESPYFTFTAEEQEAQEIGNKNGTMQRAPAITIKQDYADEYNDLSNELENEIKQYCQNFVKDGVSYDEWKAQCARWETKYKDLFDILNGTY